MIRSIIVATIVAISAICIALFFAPGPRSGVSRAQTRQIHIADQPAYDLAGIVGPVTAIGIQAAAVEAEHVETERVAAEAEAARATQSRPTTHYTEAVTTELRAVNWDGIAMCETGGNWNMVGSSFSGGVGFANTTWDGFGGREFADLAGHATREQQIIVAERVYARYGLSGWGCRAYG